jgi:hypothetical protein
MESLTRVQPSMYTSDNIYKELNTDKYLNTITYAERLADTSKIPIDPVLYRPPDIPERDWQTTIYPEYVLFTNEEDRLSDKPSIYAAMSDTFTINGHQWNKNATRTKWYHDNNTDLQIQLSGLINTMLSSLKPTSPEPILYGFPPKLLCLSFSPPDSAPIIDMFTLEGCPTIRIDNDIDPALVPPDFINKMVYTISGLLYTDPEMCSYQSRALTRTYSDRSDILMRFKSTYIDGSGMHTSYGADTMIKLINGYTQTDPATGTRVHKPPPNNNYFMIFWDIENHVIAGWILFEYISNRIPESYKNNIHLHFDTYLHVSAFCGNIPAKSNGATTFIAMFMHLCKRHPTLFHGIILDSIDIIETLLLYYSMGFRAVLYREQPSIRDSNTTVYVKGEQLMVWNADVSAPYFPIDQFEIHPVVPSVRLDKVRLLSTDGSWFGRFQTTNELAGSTAYVHPLDDLRAFIAIATKGYPLKAIVDGIAVEDVTYIHKSKLYKEFKKWMTDRSNNTRRVSTFGPRGGGYGRSSSSSSSSSRSRGYGGNGSESLVPYLYTNPSNIYYKYTHGTLDPRLYKLNDPTFVEIANKLSYDADSESSPNIRNTTRISRIHKSNSSTKIRRRRRKQYKIYPV